MSFFTPRSVPKPSALFQSRQVAHYPRPPKTTHFRRKAHPHGFNQTLDSGAVFSYNPPPAEPDINTAHRSVPAAQQSQQQQQQHDPSASFSSTSLTDQRSSFPRDPASIATRIAAYQAAPYNPLEPIVSPTTGRALPLGWKKVPGYGHLAPRLDRLPENHMKFRGAQNRVVTQEVEQEIQRLATMTRYSKYAIARKFNLPFSALNLPKPSSEPKSVLGRLNRAIEHDLRLERQTLNQAVVREAKQIRKSWW